MKIYLQKDVFEAFQVRIKHIVDNYDNIIVAFSGGKDSGLLRHLVVKYARENGIAKKIALFHQDFEAQYSATTDFVTHTMQQDLDLIEPYWTCMPTMCKTATSMYEQYWTPWDESLKEIWVRDMPTGDGVINIHNHQFDFWHPAITQEDFYTAFTPWYHQHVCGGKGRTVCLVGIRADESLNRFRAIDHGRDTDAGWIVNKGDSCYSAYPLYDWRVEDVWGAHAKFGFAYNRIYDLFHHAGLTVHQMRVASPFNDWAISSLHLYRAIEPDVWGAMVGRVNGANFTAMYGGTKAVAWKHIQKPPHHTWKSYVDFLLKTLPEETRQTYQEKFTTSIEFWRKTGGVLSDETIADLRNLGFDVALNGTSNYKSDKKRVLFKDYPDDAPVQDFASVPSYKRMAICILKNDHLCKYMGFSMTKPEQERRKAAMEKYKDL